MLLENVKSVENDAEIESEYAELEEMATNLLKNINVLLEAPGSVPAGALGGTGNHPSADDAYWKGKRGEDPVPGGARGTNRGEELPPYSTNKGSAGNVDTGETLDQVISAMENVTKQMEAAKRAMGILNQMGDSKFRTKHKSRVMGLMNKIRGNLRRVEKKFDAVLDEDPELRAELNDDMTSMEQGMRGQ